MNFSLFLPQILPMTTLTSAQEGTYTWEFDNSAQALSFSVKYNTVSNKWAVDMKKGSMDLNAFWWSNDNTIQEGGIALSKSDNSLNMNGTRVVWDGYGKISDVGLTGKEHNGSSLLAEGFVYTYNYSTTQGVNFESLLAAGAVTLGVRSTSVNTSSGIKAVNAGWDSFVPYDSTPPTLTINLIESALSDSVSSSLVTFEFSEAVLDFTASDVTVSGGTLSDFAQVDGDSWTALFTASDGLETTGSVAVAGNSYSDLANNGGGAAADTVVIDTMNPTVAISFASSTLSGLNPSTTVTFQFSEDVTSFTASDIAFTNGVLSDYAVTDANTSTATFTAINFQSATGTVAISSDYLDAVGNLGVANSANITMTVGGGPDANDGPSGGLSVVGSGTNFADSITGSTGNDSIFALNGDDTVNGGDGNDTISGGTNNDIIRGGTGNDSLVGLGGADTIYGGSGSDTINGGNGFDTIVGGFGNDVLSGGGGDRFLFLSIYDGQDVISGFTVTGTNDTIVFDITGASAFTSLGNAALGTTTYSAGLAGGFLVYSGGVLSYDHDGSAGSTFAPLPIVALNGTPTLSNSNVLFQNL